MHRHPRRQDSALHRADLPTRNVQSRWEAHHRRLVTVRDSNWMLSWNVERNPHFRNHPKGQLMIHAYGTYSLDRPGNYVKKALKDCTGEEIAREWLYHLGVPEESDQRAGGQVGGRASVHDALHHGLFMPRRDGDRPKVIPEGAVNFGFLGQLAETHPRDVIFTIEYSVRTAMEAVYTLLDIERGVPEPWLAVRRSCAAQLGDRAAGWREARAACADQGARSISRGVHDLEKTEDRRAAAGLRVHRRTRRKRAHGRDTQDPR